MRALGGLVRRAHPDATTYQLTDRLHTTHGLCVGRGAAYAIADRLSVDVPVAP